MRAQGAHTDTLTHTGPLPWQLKDTKLEGIKKTTLITFKTYAPQIFYTISEILNSNHNVKQSKQTIIFEIPAQVNGIA